MKKFSLIILLLILIQCSTKEKYDVSRYHDAEDRNKVLSIIATYILDAPPYVKMENRFNRENMKYYLTAASRLSFVKYFIAEDGTHYFYVTRPGPKTGEVRGVGGHFKMIENFQVYKFREEFVTPLLSEKDVKGRCSFLFDEMVHGNLKNYLKMETYIQWPNEISYYDSILFQWKMKPEFE